jgi:hypothetical protein
MKVFTRPIGHCQGVWEVLIWAAPGNFVTIPVHDQQHAKLFAGLLVNLINAFGPNEANRCP